MREFRGFSTVEQVRLFRGLVPFDLLERLPLLGAQLFALRHEEFLRDEPVQAVGVHLVDAVAESRVLALETFDHFIVVGAFVAMALLQDACKPIGIFWSDKSGR
ncbi:MAG: hypothetical protein IPP94_14865 [Ignavibacteria bacterium]|nr:hypothetical protein [Ignavibacteria bacterium]